MKKTDKFPTQKTIARELNISRTTVAEILGGKASHRYSEETRQKVLEAAKRLNYHPNRSAQAIRKGRSNLIGIIHFGSPYEFSRRMRHYLSQAVMAQGYELALIETPFPQEQARRIVQQLLEARVEGVIIANTIEAFGVNEVNILKSTGIPMVTLAGREEWNIPSVQQDIRTVMRQMVHHLLNLKHQRLLLLTNLYEARTTLTRIEGFVDGITEAGGSITPDFTGSRGICGKIERIHADRGGFDTAAAAYQYMKGLIAKGELPDAILCHNDHWARGVFAAAYEAGLRIPGDLAITGFDNESFGAYAPFELTTATYFVANEAEKTVEMLMDLIHDRPLAQTRYLFPCELVIRRSCGARPAELPKMI